MITIKDVIGKNLKMALGVGFLLVCLIGSSVYLGFIYEPSVTGTITFDETVNLPEDAKLTIELRDVSYADALSELISSIIINDIGRPPVNFRLEYTPNQIQSNNTYSIGVKIHDSSDRLLFINDIAHEVITHGNSNRVNIDLVLVQKSEATHQTTNVEQSENNTFIEGSISYDNDLIPSENTELIVQLRSVLPQNAPGVLIAEQVIANPGQSPMDFKLSYDPNDIADGNTYVVSATIRNSENKLLFINDIAYNIPDLGNTDKIAVNLVPVQSETTSPVPETGSFVAGVIRYDNRVSLPQDAELLIKLEEISKDPFAGNIAIAQKTVSNPGQSPIQFKIPYDTKNLSNKNLYTLLVRIYGSEGQTFLTNNFPDKALRLNNLNNLEIDLVVINPPDDSVLEDDLDASVKGTVTYARKTNLPAGSKLIVKIIDSSYADAPSDLIAEQVIVDPGKSPVKFEVKYDPNKIKKRNLYSLAISIIDSNGKFLFVNDTVYEVITRGYPSRGVRVPLVSTR